MVISVIQFKTGDAEEIREKGLSLLERALKDSPDFILLQELFTTIYFPQYINDDFFKLAEELPGSLTDRIGGLIKNADVTVIVPVFERSGNIYYCSAAVVDSRDGYLGTYRKLHIPTVKTVNESYYFKPGNLGHKIFPTRKADVGIMLCYDRHFPESARHYGLNDVDVVFVCSATPKSQKNIWLIEMQAHAFSNAFYLACSNRTGTEDKIQFLGTSMIFDYKGKILEKAGEDEDEIITADIDIDEARAARKELVFFRDRRPELYTEISG